MHNLNNEDKLPEDFQILIKKLYATLLKMNVGVFLISDEFKINLIEHNLEKTWNDLETNVRRKDSVIILASGYTGYAERTLLPFLTVHYEQNKDELDSFLHDFLLVFLSENTFSEKILNELNMRLTDLKLNKIPFTQTEDKTKKQTTNEKQKELNYDQTIKNLDHIIMTYSEIYPEEGNDVLFLLNAYQECIDFAFTKFGKTENLLMLSAHHYEWSELKDEKLEKATKNIVAKAKTLRKLLLDETKGDSLTSSAIDYDPKKVFVIHGRDNVIRLELVEMLKEKFQLEPIVLMDKDSQGATVIEKFENKTYKVGYAFVILSPDDIGCLKEDFGKHEKIEQSVNELRPRARQNVIFELGYFIGALGRKRICYIHKGNNDLLPGDLGNIVTIRFDGSVKDKYLDIETELKKAGYVKS